jgi:hypothetical protein
VKKSSLHINESLLWDIDPDAFDPHKSIKLVVERVFSLGTIDDLRSIMAFYSLQSIVDAITSVNYLDKKTLNFSSWYLNIPKKQFKCYKRNQSAKKRWN